MAKQRVQILDEAVIGHKIKRMAYEMYEQNLDEKELVLVGIADAGSVLAALLMKELKQLSKQKIELLSLTMNKKHPLKSDVNLDYDFNKKIVILVDDVTNSGKTLLYAMKAFLHAEPEKIQVAVLVDRQHKNYPVTADYIGFSVSTTLQNHIAVELKGDKIAGAYLE